MDECSQRLHFNSNEVKQQRERSQRFYFNNKVEVKQRNKCFDRVHFNSSEVK